MIKHWQDKIQILFKVMQDTVKLIVFVIRKWGIQLLFVKNDTLINWCGTQIPFAREIVITVCKKSFSVIRSRKFDVSIEINWW